MDEMPKSCEISAEDLRAARKEMDGYLDITDDDLKRIYTIALRHAEQRLARRIPVRDVMTVDVVTIRDDMGMNEAADLLSANRISGLPVVDGENRVLGVITEADLLSMAGLKKGHAFKDIIRHLLGEPLPAKKESKSIHAFMSSPAITTGPDTDIREVALILDEKRIKRLPVVDGQGKLIGVISRQDIVRTIGAS